MTARLVVMASGNGSNLQAVLDACREGTIPAEVVLVVSNNAEAYALQRAAAAGVPTAHLSLRAHRAAGRSRGDYDADLARLVAPAEPDWIVLAGWMLILSHRFLDRFPGRVVNLHPALPGEFPGAHAIAEAWEAARRGGPGRTGVMVHLVPDEEVDAGPVLATVEVPIRPDDTLDQLEQRMHAAEHRLLVDTLAALCSEPAPADEVTS